MQFEEMLANKHYRTGILCGTTILFLGLLAGFSAQFVIFVSVVVILLVAGVSMLIVKENH